MATNLKALDLAAAIEGGLIHEDVMDRIYEIDPEDRPFCDSVASDEAENQYKEFVHETLEESKEDNAFVEGQDLTDENDTRIGNRFGNYCQQMVKTVRVSDRTRSVNSIGASDQMLWQLQRRQKALRRDEESALVGVHGAQPGDGDEANKDTTGPGLLAGLASWIRTNVDRGTNGANATLSGAGGVGGYPKTQGDPPADRTGWIGIAAGLARGLTYDMIEDMMEAAYNQGGNPRLLFSIPKMIRNISSFLFDATARVATLQTYAPQGNRTSPSSQGGISGGGVTAQASVNIIVTNFGALELVPNRFQKTYQSSDGTPVAVCNVFLIDPEWFSIAYLQGYQTKDLARNGLSDSSYINVDGTLCAMAENSSACIADINAATAMAAS